MGRLVRAGHVAIHKAGEARSLMARQHRQVMAAHDSAAANDCEAEPPTGYGRHSYSAEAPLRLI
jgi:hypothetical protein